MSAPVRGGNEGEDATRNVARFVSLAKLWSRPRPAVGTTPADVVFRDNKWRLLRYRAPEGVVRRHRTPVLLVPSLINRHYVLDLLPGKSFAQGMVERGHDVFCIDWGTPGDEDRYLTFDDVCDAYLGRAIRVAARLANVERPGDASRSRAPSRFGATVKITPSIQRGSRELPPMRPVAIFCFSPPKAPRFSRTGSTRAASPGN